MRLRSLPLVAAAFVLILVMPVWAQQYWANKPLGAAAQSTPAYLKKAGISQNLGNHSRSTITFSTPVAPIGPWAPILSIARW